MICAFDSNAGPDLLREKLFKPDRMSSSRLCKNPRLQSVTNQDFEVVGTLMVHILLGEARIRIVFGIIKNLAVSILLETPFIDKLVKRVFHSKRKTVPYNLQLIAILNVHDDLVDK